jgi:hypothetical protein
MNKRTKLLKIKKDETKPASAMLELRVKRKERSDKLLKNG